MRCPPRPHRFAFGFVTLTLIACASAPKDDGAGGAHDAAGAFGGSSGGASGIAGATSAEAAHADAFMNDAAADGFAMDGGGAAMGGACGVDQCASPPGGVVVACERRFMLGVNYAWLDYGFDFGGSAAQNRGLARNQGQHLQNLMDMKGNGVDVVRWWMHPGFMSEGVVFDATDTPTGLGGSEKDDINAALALAALAGVHLKLTLFSFDSFRADADSVHNMATIIQDDGKRKALITNVVQAIARVAATSPHADRLVDWDIVNEPEWAITGSDGYGDEAFTPQSLMTVSFSTMETFVADAVKAVRAESPVPITVGQAAIKWAKAFSKVGLDHYDFHYYGWVDMYYALAGKSFAAYGVADKPVVVGEFPLDGWDNGPHTSALQILNKAYPFGYAGAAGWAFTKDGNWGANKTDIKTFAGAHGCSVSY